MYIMIVTFLDRITKLVLKRIYFFFTRIKVNFYRLTLKKVEEISSCQCFLDHKEPARALVAQ